MKALKKIAKELTLKAMDKKILNLSNCDNETRAKEITDFYEMIYKNLPEK